MAGGWVGGAASGCRNSQGLGLHVTPVTVTTSALRGGLGKVGADRTRGWGSLPAHRPVADPGHSVTPRTLERLPARPDL